MPRTSSKAHKSKLTMANKSNKARSKKQKADPKMPKKPPTAFFFFIIRRELTLHTRSAVDYLPQHMVPKFVGVVGEDFRKVYKAQNPDVKSMRDIGKAAGEKWKTMLYEEKVQYYDIATEKRAEFEKAMADYLDSKESGEDGTDSDGSSY